jgi:hypothetical protein
MIFGYLIFVSKNSKVDYLKLAYALALSIKNTQKEGYDKVALVTDDVEAVESLKSPWVFDKIIHWDQEKGWDGRSWMDAVTPWSNTVCLDADMLFFRDYSHWINYFIKNKVKLFLPSTVYSYRNELVTDDYYRKSFKPNNLPNLYSFFTFFKKGDPLVETFFKLGRHIIKNPDEFKNLFLSNYKPKVIGTDEAFSLAAKILNIQDEITYPLEFPKVVHLKPMIQNWPWPAESVSDHVGFYFDRHGSLKIGNHQQTDIVHYNEKDLITDEVVSILENIIWKK